VPSIEVQSVEVRLTPVEAQTFDVLVAAPRPLVQVFSQGPTGPTGVVAADAPITYDSGTQTVGIDGSGYVASVNGQTGTATLDAAAVGAYPDDNPSAFVDASGAAAAAPVQSVNSLSGTVVLDAAAVGAYPDSNPSGFVDAAGAAAAAPVQTVNGASGTVVLDATMWVRSGRRRACSCSTMGRLSRMRGRTGWRCIGRGLARRGRLSHVRVTCGMTRRVTYECDGGRVGGAPVLQGWRVA
jgi:hypothetical protein